MAFVVAARDDLVTNRSMDEPRRRRPISAFAKRQSMEGVRSAPSEKTQRSMRMRAIFIAALMALGLGLAGTSPGTAAPVSGSAIGHAAHLGHAVDQVHWRWRHRHHRHCWWHHRRLHCGWW
jgi:hypothetical protein